MQETFSQRHHPFERCFNFRDLGGYPAADGRRVRWGRYFRAGRQDRMTPSDREKLQQLGIKSQLDLRGHAEIRDQGRGPLEAMGAEYHHIPVIPEGGSARLNSLVGDSGISGQRYLGYLKFGSDETWRRIFHIFADPARHPVLVHCTAGKDRTGVTTAFLLGVLGVARSIIETDYALTNLDLERQADFLESEGQLMMSREQMLFLAGVPPAAMGDFLDGLESQYGGMAAYLRNIGIDDSIQEAVRSNFLSD